MSKIQNKKSLRNSNLKNSNLFRNSSFVFRTFLVLLIIYILYFNLRNSVFFLKKDRINLIYSEDQIAYYSLGLSDRVNYFIPFFQDLEVVVPGGYGYYRLGALAKLASLEKNPDLFKKTYSMITSSMVDFYFYPSTSSDKMEIFFGKKSSDFFLPGLSLLFFGESNANFFDRLYLYLHFFGKTKGQFKIINTLTTKNQGDRVTFSSDEFFEALQGIFYRRTYRSEQRNVQIVYTDSYKTAQSLGQILEGEGIRVVDLSAGFEGQGKNCEVIEDGNSFSKTAKSVSQFFGCRLSAGNTEAYDIILKLGEVEKEWEVE